MTSRLVALLFLPLLALGVTGCATGSEATVNAISRVTYSQTQAVPDFDEGEFTIEGDDLDPLRELLKKYDIDPATFRGGGDPCPGSIASDVTISFDDGTPDNTFSMDSGCEDGFLPEASVFLVNYSAGQAERDNGYGSIDYSQDQAVLDFDTATYTQGEPAEVAKFVALLAKYDIDPDGYVTETDPGCTGGVLSNVSLVNTSDIEPHIVARLELDDCGKTDGFDAEATALISEWRKAQVPDPDATIPESPDTED